VRQRFGNDENVAGGHGVALVPGKMRAPAAEDHDQLREALMDMQAVGVLRRHGPHGEGKIAVGKDLLPFPDFVFDVADRLLHAPRIWWPSSRTFGHFVLNGGENVKEMFR
jgi:hypothetical protein